MPPTISTCPAKVLRSTTCPAASAAAGCYTVCKDAGGWALDWDTQKRRPVLDEKKCPSCMVCSFACPVDGLITFKEMPKTYRRADTVTLGRELESQLKA